MIKRLLAAVLSAAMLVSISVGIATNAAWVVKPATTPLIAMDFEDGVVPKCHHTIGEFGFSEDAGVDNSKCIIIPGGWGVGSIDSKSFIFTAEANKNYILRAYVKGGFYQFFYWTEPHVQAATGKIEKTAALDTSDWAEVSFHLNFPQDQSVGVGFQSGTADLYIDQIAIYEAEEIPDPTPEITPTPSPTLPPVNPTIVPTKSPEVTPGLIDNGKITIKFVNRSIRIKKGKKVTLKVNIKKPKQIKLAKKAKFSVDKKSKKIIKIVKTKATSITIKGKKKGTAKIVARISNKKATCKIKVK